MEGGKKERPRYRGMENVELDLMNMYVTNGQHELWTKENGHFS